MLRKPSRVIAILGMHRSGTSCLTGSLQASGLALGDVYTTNPHNKKGNRESQKVINLHEGLMSYNSGSWLNPPTQCNWAAEHLRLAKKILAMHEHEPIWGFKDPRTLTALGGWKKLVPDIEFVGIFRHPYSVAQSLARRNKFSLEQGFLLWLRYNQLLLQEYKKKSFPILSFNLPEGEFLMQLQRLVDFLQLEHAEDYSSFFSTELRSQNIDVKIELPPKVIDLYRQLLSITWS